MLKIQGILPVGATIKDPFGERYWVRDCLGVGRSSVVYLVSDRNQHKKFALKEVINPSEQARTRLVQECELLKLLKHPALPEVYHVFEHKKYQRVYMLMEYIQGQDLEALRREQPDKRFPLEKVISLMAPVVDAITYLHTQNPPIVHRDIKPANIIVPTNGSVAVLVDFGTAKQYIPDGTITMSVAPASPGYAALEQHSPGSKTNLRTDVYGLGATIYALLTGLIPLDAVLRITTGKDRDPLKPIGELVSDLPEHVAQAVTRAISIYNHERYPSVAAFWRAFLGHEPTDEEQEEEKQLSLVPETPLPPLLEEDEDYTSGQNISRPLLFLNQQPPPGPKRLLVSFLSLLLVLLLVVGSLGVFLRLSSLHPGASIASPRSIHASPTSRTSPAPTATTSIYPPLAPAYTGSIADIGVAAKSTPMYLTRIQQNESQISGHFEGLGLVGPFTGTISQNGTIHLVVKITVGNLILDGTIKVGGDIQGSFITEDQQGNNLGEYGPWNISPGP
ncbi:MAG TPA: serine/threonine-protein kinase [Ktedonobacteraceae bacterium]|nr:serine/threonine-protein kinase [Ktedonobacteraceae bacterium]